MKKTLSVIVVIALILTSTLVGVQAAKKVKINKSKATIKVGQTVQLKVKNTKKKVKWKTSNKKVATVSKKGKVKGKKVGKATITAKVGKKKYRCKVSVIASATSNNTVQKPTEKPTEPVKLNEWDYDVISGAATIKGYHGSKTKVTFPSEIDGYQVVSIAGTGKYVDYYINESYNNLTEVIIPDSVVYINDEAFRGCTSLSSITIPNSMTYLGERAFEGCTSLSSITIPNSVTKIRRCTFEGCTSLKSVTISNSVTEIEYNVFDGCTSLSDIAIPNSVTKIGVGTFKDCSSLSSIIIPDSITEIEGDIFKGCSSLNSVVIPNSVTSIGSNAFRGCESLKEIMIPNSVTSICFGDIWIVDMHVGNRFSSTDSFDKTITLKGKSGSYVQTFAKEHGYTFEAID